MRLLHSGRLRFISAGVLVLLLTATIATTWILRDLVKTQERQLLHERTAEAGLVLSSTINSVKPSLQMLGAIYAVDRNSKATPLLTNGFAAALKGTTAITVQQEDRFVARVAAGPDITANQPLNVRQTRLATRAIGAKDAVSDVIPQPGTGKAMLAFAIALPGGIVVYQDLPVNPAQLTTSKGGSPFNELQGAFYAAPTEQASKLVFATAKDLPLRGTVDRQTVRIGADKWFLIASAREPLVGSFATAAPWIVFALGVLVSLVAFAAAEILLRRRAYALALVEERTGALRHTMRDLEAARTSAETANRAKSEFLSRMSHELRTPLNAVLGFAQVLELGDLTHEQQQSVNQIAKGGRHLLELINEVLDISRIETGNLTLSPEPVLVADIVSDVLDLIHPLAVARDIRCEARAGETRDAGYVLADRQRLKQVVLNLVSNAVKYNDPGGTVTVSCARVKNDHVRISVRDDGPGIPTEQRALLFEPFERLGAELTSTEGAGIGLALSRRLTELMNGVLDVDSRPGEGSTFWVELACAEGPVERLERMGNTEVTAPVVAHDRASRTVLYIEDNVANVKLIEQIFRHRPDINLVAAMQGRIGIDLAQQHHPALILLDLHLPDLSGEAVLAQLRANPDTADIPIVVLTADATERQEKRLLAAGATAYVTKPLDVPQLLDLVTGILEAETEPAK